MDVREHMKREKSRTPSGYQGQVIVIDHVPADVCSVCGDVLLNSDTVRRIEGLLQEKHQPASTVPLYEFA